MKKFKKLLFTYGVYGALFMLPFDNLFAQDKDSKTKNEKMYGQNLKSGDSAESASFVVKKLQEFYDKTTDFQADFEQIYKHKIYGEEKKSSGKVYIQRPGKMRWEYQKPEKKLFIADGSSIWIYDEAINQVTKQPFSESDLPVAITFLVGKGKIEDEFDYKLVQHEKFASQGKIVLELTPKKVSAHYKKLLFIVDKKNYQVERTIIIDDAGNTNTMRFKNPQFNKGLDPKKFQFKPPKGAKVIQP